MVQESLINPCFDYFQTALSGANKDSPGSIVRSSISGCRPLDPGSNPGQGAKIRNGQVLHRHRTAEAEADLQESRSADPFLVLR